MGQKKSVSTESISAPKTGNYSTPILAKILDSPPYLAVKTVIRVLNSVGPALGQFQAIPSALLDTINTLEVSVARFKDKLT